MRGVPGSRLFFALAALHAVLSVPLWLALRSTAALDQAVFAGPLWHGHEMIFGYVPAVMAGFLTLGSRGWANLLCAALWLVARAGAMLAMGDAWWLVALADAVFLPLVVATRRPPLWSGMKPFSLMLMALALIFGALNLNLHLAARGFSWLDPQQALALGVDLVMVLLVVVGGRLIPAHTRAATRRGVGLRLVWSERSSAVLACAVLVAGGFALDQLRLMLMAVLFALQLYRLVRWWDRAILADPLLWVLHAGFAWLTLGIGLRALALPSGLVDEIDALHAIFVGAVGSLTLGMMTRLDLARKPAAGLPRGAAAAFALVSIAAALRVLLGAGVAPALAAAAGAWALAFAWFLAAQAGLLRLKGQEGRAA